MDITCKTIQLSTWCEYLVFAFLLYEYFFSLFLFNSYNFPSFSLYCCCYNANIPNVGYLHFWSFAFINLPIKASILFFSMLCYSILWRWTRLLVRVFPGRPAMPIYWAFGYHLCRWGYKTSNSTWELLQNMRNSGIPQVMFPKKTKKTTQTKTKL